MNPRKPTEEEKKQLIEFLLRNENPDWYDAGYTTEEDRKKEAATVATARIAVFDECTPSSKYVYAGKVMVVVWPAGSEYTQVYTWYRDGA